MTIRKKSNDIYKCLYSIYLENKKILLYTEHFNSNRKTPNDFYYSYGGVDIYLDFFNKKNNEYNSDIRNIRKEYSKFEIINAKNVSLEEAKKIYYTNKEIFILPNHYTLLTNNNVSSNLFIKIITKNSYNNELFSKIINKITFEYNCNVNNLLFLVKEKSNISRDKINEILNKRKKEENIPKVLYISDNPQNKFTFGIEKDDGLIYYFRDYDVIDNTILFTKNIVKSKLFISQAEVQQYLMNIKSNLPIIYSFITKDAKRQEIKITKIRIENLKKI